MQRDTNENKNGLLRVATTNIATTDDVTNSNSQVKTIGDVLSELNSNKANKITVESVIKGNYVANAGLNDDVAIDAAKSSYTPIGILGIQFSVANRDKMSLVAFRLRDTTAYLSFNSTVAQTIGAITMYVLYLKS